MLAAVDWMVVALVVLVVLVVLLSLSLVGLGAFLVGIRIERDAGATPENEITRASKRSGGNFITVGAIMTLSCALGAIVMVLLIAMPIRR